VIRPVQLIAAARQLIGTPVVHQGHSIYGVDCIGVAYAAAKNAGAQEFTDLVDRELSWTYGRSGMPTMLTEFRRHLQPSPHKAGCLLLFQFPWTTDPNHMAIFTGSGLIQALFTERRVCEHGYTQPWVGYLHSSWAMPGVIYE
jgi:cell wall-associated NlpC family hydrolase